MTRFSSDCPVASYQSLRKTLFIEKIPVKLEVYLGRISKMNPLVLSQGTISLLSYQVKKKLSGWRRRISRKYWILGR
jgi:hypothetical protein